jgi:hypothetical protein
MLGVSSKGLGRKEFKMFGSKFSGIEITIYESNGSVVCKPTYEAHTVERAVALIDQTKALLTAGRTITWVTF